MLLPVLACPSQLLSLPTLFDPALFRVLPAGASQAAPAASAGASRQSGASRPAAATADVEAQLAALSAKLGQLSICLQSMQQPAPDAEAAEEGQLR